MFLIILLLRRGTEGGGLKFEVCTKTSQGRTFCLCCCIHSFGSGISVGSFKNLVNKGCTKWLNRRKKTLVGHLAMLFGGDFGSEASISPDTSTATSVIFIYFNNTIRNSYFMLNTYFKLRFLKDYM